MNGAETDAQGQFILRNRLHPSHPSEVPDATERKFTNRL